MHYSGMTQPLRLTIICLVSMLWEKKARVSLQKGFKVIPCCTAAIVVLQLYCSHHFYWSYFFLLCLIRLHCLAVCQLFNSPDHCLCWQKIEIDRTANYTPGTFKWAVCLFDTWLMTSMDEWAKLIPRWVSQDEWSFVVRGNVQLGLYDGSIYRKGLLSIALCTIKNSPIKSF